MKTGTARRNHVRINHAPPQAPFRVRIFLSSPRSTGCDVHSHTPSESSDQVLRFRVSRWASIRASKVVPGGAL
eukprot:842419-Prymnesium_polylepis.1